MGIVSIKIKDKSNIGKSKRKYNQAGYLVLPDCVIARSGILQYSDVITETGDIVADGALIQVNRPPEALKECYLQFANLPLTLEHPDDDEVNPDNAKSITVGSLGSNPRYKEKDGVGYIICDIIVYDKEAQEKIESGETAELSAGYETAFRQKRGITPIGQQYEAEQFLLVPNHVALVERGRCGSECRVCDSKTKKTHKLNTGDKEMGKTKKTKTRYFMPIGDGDEVIELTEEQADQIIENDPDVEIEDEDEENIDIEEDVDVPGVENDEDLDDLEKEEDEEEEEIKTQTESEEEVEDEEETEEETEATEEEVESTDDGEGLTFEVQFDDGSIGKMDQIAYEHVRRFLEVSKSGDKKVGDSLSNVLVLASKAGKILGPDFDIEKYTKADSVDTNAIKRDIIRKVMPGVVVSGLKSDALDSLYKNAIKTHSKKKDSYEKDVQALCKLENPMTKTDSKGEDMVSKAKERFIKKIHKAN